MSTYTYVPSMNYFRTKFSERFTHEADQLAAEAIFDAALAKRDAEVKAAALEEAAAEFKHGAITFVGTSREYTQAWLRARAEAIRTEGGKTDD